MQSLRQLVCGTDFSDGAARAFAVAIELAAAAGSARIALVHVSEFGADDLDDRRLRAEDEALSRLVARQRHQPVEVTGVLRCGRPWEKLDNVAAEVGASLIVVGRQGAGRGRSAEIGSVADRLVRCASRPVLIVASEF